MRVLGLGNIHRISSLYLSPKSRPQGSQTVASWLVWEFPGGLGFLVEGYEAVALFWQIAGGRYCVGEPKQNSFDHSPCMWGRTFTRMS